MSEIGNSKSIPELVLLVDDEPQILFGSSVMLRQAGFRRVQTLDDIRRLLPLLQEEEPGTIILDLQMPYISGKEMLGELSCRYPGIPVIVVTAANELETAIDCMKLGAFDYIVKPVDATRFVTSVRKALDRNAMRREIDSLRESLLTGRPANEEVFATINTRSPRMKAIFGYLEAVAPSDQPVLITGETGVGKELIARAVHELSGRRGNFVPVNSAGVDDQVFSDTLFGHKKGAYTGADQAREGMIARAAGGTLFLDEIGEMSPATQVKLLRLLQEGEYYPLGADLPSVNQARVVVATNRDLGAAMVEGNFRRDLYYRLCAHQVQIPPLRERSEDIPLLLQSFIEEAARTLNREIPEYPYELPSLLAGYGFPGNVRELRAMVFDAVTRHQRGTLSVASFRDITGVGLPALAPAHDEGGEWLNLSAGFPTLAQITQSLIGAALSRTGGNQRAAAELLGISRQALNQRISKK